MVLARASLFAFRSGKTFAWSPFFYQPPLHLFHAPALALLSAGARTVLPEHEPAPSRGALGRNRVRAVGERSGARRGSVAWRGGGTEQQERRRALELARVHDPAAGGLRKTDADGAVGTARTDLDVVRVR
jgi:hypothetical protein